MDLTQFYKSVLDQDTAPVVLCDVNHIVVYMNKAAYKRYEQRGGNDLVGNSLMRCHSERSAAMIQRAVDWFAESPENNILYESRNDEENKDVYMVALRDDSGNLIGYYEKHCYRTNETGRPFEMK